MSLRGETCISCVISVGKRSKQEKDVFGVVRRCCSEPGGGPFYSSWTALGLDPGLQPCIGLPGSCLLPISIVSLAMFVVLCETKEGHKCLVRKLVIFVLCCLV